MPTKFVRSMFSKLIIPIKYVKVRNATYLTPNTTRNLVTVYDMIDFADLSKKNCFVAMHHQFFVNFWSLSLSPSSTLLPKNMDIIYGWPPQSQIDDGL